LIERVIDGATDRQRGRVISGAVKRVTLWLSVGSFSIIVSHDHGITMLVVVVVLLFVVCCLSCVLSLACSTALACRLECTTGCLYVCCRLLSAGVARPCVLGRPLWVQSMTQASAAEPSMPVCYYAGNPSMGDCLQRRNVVILMASRRASPKWRWVCEVCSAWLLRERLANAAPSCVMVPPLYVARVSGFLFA